MSKRRGAATGEIEDGLNVADESSRATPRSFRTREPVLIVGEVTNWTGHTNEQLQAMRDGLTVLRRGLAVVATERRPASPMCSECRSGEQSGVVGVDIASLDLVSGPGRTRPGYSSESFHGRRSRSRRPSPSL
jgi:hypothetical protein